MRTSVLPFLILMIHFYAFAGKESGGGFAIRCDDGKLYDWDFINRPIGSMPIDPAYQNARDAKVILQLMERKLRLVNKPMADSLADLAKFNDDPFDSTTHRLWVSSSNPLVPVGDEDRSRIPQHCVALADHNFQLKQAIVRKAPGNTTYEYDSHVLRELEQSGALQLSFLYIHEWLRDFTSEASSIKMANQILHSSDWKDASQFNFLLSRLGLNIPHEGATPYITPGHYKYKASPSHHHELARNVSFYRDPQTLELLFSGELINLKAEDAAADATVKLKTVQLQNIVMVAGQGDSRFRFNGTTSNGKSTEGLAALRASADRKCVTLTVWINPIGHGHPNGYVRQSFSHFCIR